MKILIVGGVAGGAAAAARARRLNEKATIIMFERGGHISFANCGLPYYIGDVITDKNKLLLQTPESFAKRFNVDVRVNSRVDAIDRENRQIIVTGPDGSEYAESYDTLILSPGAEPFRPPIAGADLPFVFTVRTVPDIEAIKIYREREAVRTAAVIGGGFIGIEMAENLREKGVQVTLIEKLDQVMPPYDKDMAVILNRELISKGIGLRLSSEAAAIGADRTVTLKSGEVLKADMVILCVGVKPETTLARNAGLKIGQRGITVNQFMQTSDKNIYAVGDAVEIKNFITGKDSFIPLAWPAAKGGVVAANTIFNIPDSFKGSVGTSVVKVFRLTAAMTGMSEKALRAEKIPYKKVYTHPADHAGYYPGATPMHLKLLYRPETGSLLGAQCIGVNGVDKRIDVLATAIRGKMTVYDLAELDLCYAPPYGSAKDAVILAGMAALNDLRGISPLRHWEDLTGQELLLDVRTGSEVEAGAVPDAVNIPVDELRGRLGEIAKTKDVAVFCQVGVRAHIATRILRENGYRAVNLSGGYKTYLNLRDSRQKEPVLTEEPTTLKEAFCTQPTGQAAASGRLRAVKEIDVSNQQCPGPVVQLKNAVDSVETGEIIKIISNDIGFAADLPQWCRTTHNRLVQIDSHDNRTVAYVAKGQNAACGIADQATCNDKTTLVVFSGDLDKAMAALIIARGALSSGRSVSLFFTFWGLNILKKPEKPPVAKDFLSRMFGMMMPASARDLTLSKLNMAGMGTAMMKYVMSGKKVESVETMLAQTIKEGAELIACSMSMEVMGIKKEELIDDIKIGGVAYYMGQAAQANHNLFI